VRKRNKRCRWGAQRARAIALWRFSVIEPVLLAKTRKTRHRALKRICRAIFQKPNGATEKVGRATAYRWLHAYAKGGVEALAPKPSKARGMHRAPLPAEAVEMALRYLAQDPEMSLPLVITLISGDPAIKKILEKAGTAKISRSTLQRRLAENALYVRLRRVAKQQKARTRFVPCRPHETWHLDAKGPVTITLASGEDLTFHVLSVLDGATRAILASLVVDRENLRAAVLAFRRAASLYGLPDEARADRGSPYDAHVFREGVALLGTCRLWVKSRDPESNGKIEAFHRFLVRWFFRLLSTQRVVDAVHLQQLLDVVIEHYMDHPHRELGRRSPREVLGGVVSKRTVSHQRLADAFSQIVVYRAHQKTGEIDLPGGRGKFCVPPELRGQEVEVLLDQDLQVAPLLLEPGTDRRLPLVRAAVAPENASPKPTPSLERWGEGLLQKLHDQWHGKVRPIAEPGFGLPEIFDLLAGVAGRSVPESDAEAALVLEAYRAIGPLARRPTESAFRAIARQLGSGRPLKTYLDALKGRVVPEAPRKPGRKKSS
jgi:transposase InsO family protein